MLGRRPGSWQVISQNFTVRATESLALLLKNYEMAWLAATGSAHPTDLCLAIGTASRPVHLDPRVQRDRAARQ